MVEDDALDRKGGKVNSRGEPKLSAQAIQAAWPTPTSLAHAKNGNNEAGNSAGLVAIRKHAIAASWPTPTSRDHKDGPYCPNVPVNDLPGRTEVARGRSPDLAAQVTAMWPTARANDSTGAKIPPGRMGGVALKTAVQGVWPTPKRSDFTPGHASGAADSRRSNLNDKVMVNGSSAPTEKPGALNPAFVCWLMGYPTAWVSCGVSVTRSTPARRKPS
jgi:hypothetical protein